MKKQLEIATIKANSPNLQGCELYWLLSRNQLEFIFKEIEIFSSPPFVATAKYQEAMLPVINLEKYYGLEENDPSGSRKYLVIRSINEEKKLVKLIVQTSQTLKIHKLESEFESLQFPALPQHSKVVLGMYSIATGQVGIVPNFVEMSRSLQLRGNRDL